MNAEDKRRKTWKVLGGEEALREENKLAYEPPPPRLGGVWEDDGDGDGDGKKNVPLAGQGNQTSSLLAQAHREMKMGKIKVGNILWHKAQKM